MRLVASLAAVLLSVGIGAAVFLAVGGPKGSAPSISAEAPPDLPSLSLQPWPDFRNKVLHWQFYGYEFLPDSPDAANGQDLVADIWVKVASDNTSDAARAITRYSDGRFRQESVWRRNGTAIQIMDIAEPPNAPVGWPHPCRTEGGPPLEVGPLFPDPTSLRSAGYKAVQAPTTDIPALKRASLSAEAAIGGAGADVWRLEIALANGRTEISTIELDEGVGYLRSQTLVQRLPGGTEVVQQRKRVTSIEVLPADTVPTSVFEPETEAEPC
ncbi:MAG TPA: hypothetical protein VFT91_01415 [Dehalococcoidia bacterium]|nr:hypothetical protein [Dehalococcoidia bacterium]